EHDGEPVDATGDLPHAPSPPGPDLRADVVQHRHAGALGQAGEAEVELRKVDEDAEIRRRLAEPARERPVRPPEGPHTSRRLRQPDGRDVARVGDRLHAGLAQPLAAEAEDLEIRQRGAQRAYEVGGMEVARGLAGDEQQPARPIDDRPGARSAAVAHRAPALPHAGAATCAARTSVSRLSRITCATSRARSPSQPLTGGGSRSRTARRKASISAWSASPSGTSRSSSTSAARLR